MLTSLICDFTGFARSFAKTPPIISRSNPSIRSWEVSEIFDRTFENRSFSALGGYSAENIYDETFRLQGSIRDTESDETARVGCLTEHRTLASPQPNSVRGSNPALAESSASGCRNDAFARSRSWRREPRPPATNASEDTPPIRSALTPFVHCRVGNHRTKN